MERRGRRGRRGRRMGSPPCRSERAARSWGGRALSRPRIPGEVVVRGGLIGPEEANLGAGRAMVEARAAGERPPPVRLYPRATESGVLCPIPLMTASPQADESVLAPVLAPKYATCPSSAPPPRAAADPQAQPLVGGPRGGHALEPQPGGPSPERPPARGCRPPEFTLNFCGMEV